MDKSLESILKFAELLHEFRKVERRVFSNGMERFENDVEHSFNLAMIAWYINETLDLKLDTEKLLKYSLAHDLVEVYAGDTWFFTNEEEKKDKHAREESAAKKIKEEFGDFEELHNIIEEYEKRDNKESNFIYALDKVEPLFSIYLDKGRTWNHNKITLEQIKELKPPKVKDDPVVKKILEELLEKFKEEKKELFS